MNWLEMTLLFPLLGAVLNGFILRSGSKTLSQIVSVTACLLAFFCALCLSYDVLIHHDGQKVYHLASWIEAGSLSVSFSFLIDPLSSLMLLIITGIGSLIHIYAGGYMSHEKTTYRFFAYLNLFIFMMLLLVTGENFLIMFIGWEGVGLCSYLLISYWFEEDNNAKAGMKAFLVNRIGDIGFLFAVFLTFKQFGTLSFMDLKNLLLNSDMLTKEMQNSIALICLLMLVAACGKSAQLPLYVWLPDAMAGPTPVSALIHAATMVTAGVYMMTRLSFFYFLAPQIMTLVAVLGCLTAFFAATIALVQNDIKKVLAYSTVSQLGYMVMGCGVGGFGAGVFHLLTHACFKALLFLGAGSVIFAMHHKQDMMEMGGLKKYLPKTHGVFLLGVLAIIGVPGFSGFFSKDEILWKAFNYPVIGPYLWAFGTLTAGCTAFYMLRLYTLTFCGENRSDHHTREHLEETPLLMWGPLTILAFLSVFIGFIGVPAVIGDLVGIPNFFEHYLESVIKMPHVAEEHWHFLHDHHSHALEWTLMGTSTSFVLLGAFLGFNFYKRGPKGISVTLKKKFSGAHKFLTNKYYVDEFYENIFVTPLQEMSQFLWKIFDLIFINGFINGVGRGLMISSALSSWKNSGGLQTYAVFFVLGCLVFLGFFLK